MNIAERLAADERYSNRLRTTLTHEYGHVRFHAYLWEMEPPGPDLLRRDPRASMQVCYRDKILDAAQSDWMEWQAGYVCGALLMPAVACATSSVAISNRTACSALVGERDLHGAALIETVKSGIRGFRRRCAHPPAQARNPWRGKRRTISVRRSDHNPLSAGLGPVAFRAASCYAF